MLCSLCVCKKHHHHQIVDLETEEVKYLTSETLEAITPQINAYDVCFPELQSDLVGNMAAFKQGMMGQINQLSKLNYAPAKQEGQNCIAIGDQFEEICEKYLSELRLCNTGIKKLINEFSGSS
ncbi:unnamed protein product, partial [Mesorhabditis belari]|uniref:Uncharacterized protein n=1 Tax=Mesorhabditis belari TaxID=2138241 RepID=A0AAF3J3P4_9BILA